MPGHDAIAIDVGGTFIKTALVRDGLVVGQPNRHPIPCFLDSSGSLGDPGQARELDASEVDAAVHEAVARLGDVSARTVYVSGQMACLAFVDDRGHAVAPIISWQDTRATSVDRVVQELGSSVLADLGDGIRVGSPLVTLREIGYPEGAYVTSLIAYVAGRMANLRAEVVHATDAGSWGLLDTRAMRWSDTACGLAGLDPGRLPRVSTSMAPIAPGSRVFAAIGDQQASLLGSSLQPGWLSVNLATGCQVSLIADEFADDLPHVQTRPYFGRAHGGRYLHTVSHLPGGRLLTSELTARRGHADWEWLARSGEDELASAFNTIIEGVGEAAERLGGMGRPVLFSGGLIQGLPNLRDRIIQRLEAVELRVFDGDDAALAGLARLA